MAARIKEWGRREGWSLHENRKKKNESMLSQAEPEWGQTGQEPILS